MAVTFTSRIGLAKPTESELALEWARISKLAEDNNLIIVDKMDIEQTTILHTNNIKGRLSDPNLGVGWMDMVYQDFQGFVMGSFVIRMGNPGVTAGSGEYGIPLPFVADSTYHIVGTALDFLPGFCSVIGEGYVSDASNINTSGVCAIDVVTVGGVSYARLVTETYAGKTTGVMSSSGPFVLNDTDRFSGNFFYKRV